MVSVWVCDALGIAQSFSLNMILSVKRDSVSYEQL